MKGLRIGRTHQGGTVRTTDPKIAAQYAGKKNTLVITDGLSDFYRYFSPILSALDDLYWLIASDTFSCGFPNEWRENAWYDEKIDMFRSPQIDEFETHILQRGPGTSLFTKPGFLAKYCQYFYEDWCDMFSFQSAPEDVWAWWRSYECLLSREEANEYLIQHDISICFFNIDGAFWELFARDEALLQEVEQALRGKSEFSVYACGFEERAW